MSQSTQQITHHPLTISLLTHTLSLSPPQLINDYLRDNYWLRVGITNRDVRTLNTAACRLMLDILPGLETSAVFQPDMENLIHRLFSWAEKSSEPLQSYATGLLAAAMEVQDIATGFREQNGKMVPLMLKRLRKLQEKAAEEWQAASAARPFAHLGQSRQAADAGGGGGNSEHKVFPGKRKARDKRENGVVAGTTGTGTGKRAGSPPELADYSSDEEQQQVQLEELRERELVRDEASSPPSKKLKTEVVVEEEAEGAMPVVKREAYPEMMSPPLTVPPYNASSGRQVRLGVRVPGA